MSVVAFTDAPTGQSGGAERSSKSVPRIISPPEEEDKPKLHTRKPPRSLSLTPEPPKKHTIDSKRSREELSALVSDFEGLPLLSSDSSRKDSSIKRSSGTSSSKTQVSKRRSAPNPKSKLRFDKGSPVVKAGSIVDLAVWLIDCADKELILSFLIGFPAFWKPEQLFRFLIDTFRKSRHDSSPQGSRDVFSTLDFLKLWVDSYWQRDFERVPKVAQMLEDFLDEMALSGLTDFANRIKLLILKRVGQVYVTQVAQVWASKTKAAAPPTVSSGSSSAKTKRSRDRTMVRSDSTVASLVEIAATDLAEQLTLVEFDMFCEIEEKEFLQKVWLPPPRTKTSSGRQSGYASSNERMERHSAVSSPKEGSPNYRLSQSQASFDSPRSRDFALNTMIDHFNKVSLWVASEIVRTADIKERSNLIKKFINIAERLLELNNFNSLMEIISGMNMTAVQRLQRTWTLVPGPSRASFERMSILVSTKQNFQNYRSALANAKLPVLPYIGVYLRDLIFIEEANPCKLESGLINFDKIHLEGKLVLEVRKFQRERFQLKPQPNVQDFIRIVSPMTEDDIFAQSLRVEPDDALAQALNVFVQPQQPPSPRDLTNS